MGLARRQVSDFRWTQGAPLRWESTIAMNAYATRRPVTRLMTSTTSATTSSK